MITYADPVRLQKRGVLSKVYYSRIYNDRTGRRSWVSTGCRNYSAAREWVRTQEMKQALGKDRLESQAGREMTFRKAFTSWIEEKREKVSENHFGNLLARGEAFWLPFFGNAALEDLTPDFVREYFKKRRAGTLRKLDDAKTHRRLSHTTLNNDLRYLRSLLSYCRDCGWLSHNPLRGVESYSGAMKRRTRTITEEEESKLLQACKSGAVVKVSARRNRGGRKGGKVSQAEVEFSQTVPAPDYLYPLVLVALRCGFRRRTLLSLRWRDVDLEKADWRIPAEFLKTAEDYNAPVPQGVVEDLKAYRRGLAEVCQMRGRSTVERLGPNAHIFGLPPDAKIRRSFQTAVGRAGLSLTFHDLRRIFLNRLRDRGVSIEAAMALTGHKSLQTVLGYYREVPPSELRRAVAAVDRAPESFKASSSENPPLSPTPPSVQARHAESR